jgi:hypothetical protein
MNARCDNMLRWVMFWQVNCKKKPVEYTNKILFHLYQGSADYQFSRRKKRDLYVLPITGVKKKRCSRLFLLINIDNYSTFSIFKPSSNLFVLKKYIYIVFLIYVYKYLNKINTFTVRNYYTSWYRSLRFFFTPVIGVFVYHECRMRWHAEMGDVLTGKL